MTARLRRWTIGCALSSVVALAGPAHAQDAPAAPAAPVTTSWQWRTDGRVFVGYNYQHRKFTDFDEWESQNWIMATAERPLGRGVLRLGSMFSFEPFTCATSGRRRSSRPARRSAARRSSTTSIRTTW
jgi:hypothetical protein